MGRRWLSTIGVISSILVLSCGESVPTSIPPVTSAPEASLLGSVLQPLSLLSCAPLPYDSVTQPVGPTGGVIHVGPHTLTIPAGALTSPVSVTAVVPSDAVNRIRFQPEGLVFRSATALRMSYANCQLLGIVLPKRIVYTSDALQILQSIPSLDDVSSQIVTGQVWHFSNYAIAY
jgi:hypothetical protein